MTRSRPDVGGGTRHPAVPVFAPLRRRMLGWLIDLWLFRGVWTVVSGALAPLGETAGQGAVAAKWLAFLCVELLLFRRFNGSPGFWALGIWRETDTDVLARLPVGSDDNQFVVDSHHTFRERWWTLLFGMLAILDGMKAMVSWPLGSSSLPLFGAQLGEPAATLVHSGMGLVEVIAGVAALRLHRHAVLLGPLLFGLQLTSVLAGWSLWPDWIEQTVLAGRAAQGLPVRAGEVAWLQAMLPEMMLTLTVFFLLWSVLVARHARRQAPRPTC